MELYHSQSEMQAENDAAVRTKGLAILARILADSLIRKEQNHHQPTRNDEYNQAVTQRHRGKSD